MIDEADLILSYGHDEDVRQILSGNYLPTVFQSFLMSATMTKDVEALKGLVLRNPVSFVVLSWLLSAEAAPRLFFVWKRMRIPRHD